jgi:hypothetical protein
MIFQRRKGIDFTGIGWHSLAQFNDVQWLKKSQLN